MKNLLKYTGIGVLGILFVVLMGCEKEPSPTSFTTHDNIPHGTVETVSFASTYTGGDTRNVNVYLPLGYSATDTTEYPVVYLLHGFGGSDSTWLESYNVDQVVDWLVYNNQIDPMIIVMPNAYNDLGGSFYTNSIDVNALGFDPLNPATWVGFGLFEWYIVGAPGGEGVDPNSVMGYIEQDAYAGRIDATKRGIAGHSMGGYGAMKLALLHPNLFKAVASLSGPVAFAELLGAAQQAGEYDIFTRVGLENPGTNKIDATTLGTAKPLSTTMFGMASAFSPHYGNIMGFDTINNPGGSGLYQYPLAPMTAVDYLGIDLPITVDTTAGVTIVDTVTSVWNRWLAQDVYTLIAMPTINPMYTIDLTAFGQLAIYLDCGTEDDLNPTDDVVGFGLIYHNGVFDQLLTSQGISHTYEEYTGSHSSTVYYRLDNSLGFISNAF